MSSRLNKKLIVAMVVLISFGCTTKKSVKFAERTIPRSSNIAVIVDAQNNIKNVILAKFLSGGFRVTAFNASDFYTLNDTFDIRDFKKLSSNISGDSLPSMEKTYNNIYKLHVYNFELSKAEFLADLRNKYGVQYLIVFDLKNWEQVSWARVIDLRTYDIIWIENYPTKYNDSIDSVLDHFVAGISGVSK